MLHFFSLITFSWLGKTLQQGNKRQLDSEDMFALPSFDTPEECVSRLEKKWSPLNPRSFLVSSTMSEFKGMMFAGVVFFMEAVIQVGNAYLLGQLTRLLQDAEDSGDGVDDQELYLYAMGISICAFMCVCVPVYVLVCMCECL